MNENVSLMGPSQISSCSKMKGVVGLFLCLLGIASLKQGILPNSFLYSISNLAKQKLDILNYPHYSLLHLVSNKNLTELIQSEAFIFVEN